jgi:hypothetical protein
MWLFHRRGGPRSCKLFTHRGGGIADTIPRDRNKIVLDSEDQVRVWTKHFGVTQHELARAIELLE